jgi:hypothetical protein
MIRASSVVQIPAVGPSWNVAPSMDISVGAVAIVSGATMQLAVHLLLSQSKMMRTWSQGRTTMTEIVQDLSSQKLTMKVFVFLVVLGFQDQARRLTQLYCNCMSIV